MYGWGLSQGFGSGIHGCFDFYLIGLTASGGCTGVGGRGRMKKDTGTHNHLGFGK